MAVTQPRELLPKTLQPAVARRLAFIVGVGIVSLVFLFLLTPEPQSASNASDKKTAVAEKPSILSEAPAEPRPIGAYASLLRSDLFRPLIEDRKRTPSSSPSLPAGSPGVNMEMLPPANPSDVGESGLPSANQPKISPGLKGWSYIGSVTVDGAPFALLQKSGSGDYGYYRVGEKVDGLTIQRVLPNALVIGQPGAYPVRMPKTSGATSTSSNNARTANNNAQGGQNAPQGNASAASNNNGNEGGGPPGGFPGREAFMQMSPEQRQQMREQFMRNRGENRGGGEQNRGGDENRGDNEREEREDNRGDRRDNDDDDD